MPMIYKIPIFLFYYYYKVNFIIAFVLATKVLSTKLCLG